MRSCKVTIEVADGDVFNRTVSSTREIKDHDQLDEPIAWAIDDCVRALQVMANDERVSPDETARAWIVDCDLEIREEVVE